MKYDPTKSSASLNNKVDMLLNRCTVFLVENQNKFDSNPGCPKIDFYNWSNHIIYEMKVFNFNNQEETWDGWSENLIDYNQTQ